MTSVVWPSTSFAGRLTQAEAALLRDAGEVRSYETGGALCREGEQSEWVGVVLTGRLTVCSGDSRAVLAVLGPGELVGELSAFDHRPRSATVLADGPVDVLVIAGARFRGIVGEQPRLAVLLLDMLTRRLRDADRKRVEFGAHDTVGRVARRLSELAELRGETVVPAGGIGPEDPVPITLPLSRVELEGWTGASHDAVSRALGTLRRRKLVRTERHSIVVLDPEGLRRLT